MTIRPPRAQIWDLQLSAATTYYIVVSGWGNETGRFIFTMTSSDSSDSEPPQSDSNASDVSDVSDFEQWSDASDSNASDVSDLGSDMDFCAPECGAELLVPLRGILDRCSLCALPYPPHTPSPRAMCPVPHTLAHALNLKPQRN